MKLIHPSGKDAPAVVSAAQLERRLRRLFPKRDVHVQSRDYGHSTLVSFVLTRIPARAAMCLRGPVTDVPGIAEHVGGEILRHAYPRGWATP